jgi:hypothetical protein
MSGARGAASRGTTLRSGAKHSPSIAAGCRVETDELSRTLRHLGLALLPLPPGLPSLGAVWPGESVLGSLELGEVDDGFALVPVPI